MAENFEMLRAHTLDPMAPTGSKCCLVNKVSKHDAPIFLKRKRREAK
jgi:hypothetical protein